MVSFRYQISFNPFEAFGIDGGSTSFKKDVVAPELSIKVLPLPNRPANFSGGVGHFNLSAQLNKKEVKAGNPITIRVVVSGAGNLKLIKQPIIQIPKGVESYDVKVTDKTQLTTKGAEGNMIYDQVVIPHQEGLVAIPPVKFCYYDLSQKEVYYVTGLSQWTWLYLEVMVHQKTFCLLICLMRTYYL